MGGYERAAVLGRRKHYQTAQTCEGAIPNAKGAGQGIYQESETQKADVGTRLALGDGRVFYYCKNGSVALVRGKPVQSPTPVSDIDDCSTAAAGDDKIYLTDTAAAYTTGDFANGYAVFYDVGYMHKIRNNDTIASAGAGYVYLYDPIVVALTTPNVILFKNPCHSVIALADAVSFMIGVPLIAVQANYYFWAQTWGPTACLTPAVAVQDSTRLMIPHVSGVSIMAMQEEVTGTGVTGAQTIGYNAYDSVALRAVEYELIYLTCMA